MTATANPHDRIVTPDTDPGRWLPEEVDLFRAFLCSWQVAYGTPGDDEYCRRASKPDASFRYCPEHEAELLVEFWPDGTRRYHDAGEMERDPDYPRRLEAAVQAHQRNCNDPGCECRGDWEEV
jgi:hypothetical protein